MIILDTNVISEPFKAQPNQAVVLWLDMQDQDSLFTTALNLAEILQGIAVMPDGTRKRALSAGIEIFRRKFSGSILVFDGAAAVAHSALVVRAKAQNYTLPLVDGFIAAIASVHGFTVATRDTAPFEAAGVAVVNPWEA